MEETDPAQKLYKERSSRLGLDKEMEPLAMWSFVLSLAFLYIGWLPFINLLLFATIPASVILAFMGINRIKRDPKKSGFGFAIAALCIAGLQLLFVVVAFLLVGNALLSGTLDITAT